MAGPLLGTRTGPRLLPPCAALAAAAWLLPRGQPEAKQRKRAPGGATKVAAVMPAALAEVYPGLCLPVAAPLCTNAAQDQVHIYSQSCSAAGRFEGRRLRPG